MLQSLDIHNLAFVEQASLDFFPGLNVISGETGAGKSLMIAALGLVLGDRSRTFRHIDDQAATDVVQSQDANSSDTRVSAEFVIYNTSDALQWLIDNDVAGDVENTANEAMVGQTTCHMRRRIINGRSKAFINGVAVGVHDLQQLGDMLVNLHSQHQHHALLDKKYQRRQLDRVADAEVLAKQVQHAYTDYHTLCKQNEQAKENEISLQRELAFAQHNLDELNAFAPQAGEYEQLDQQHKQAHHFQDIALLVEKTTDVFEGDTNTQGIASTLQKLSQSFAAFDIDRMQTIAASLTQAVEVISEVQYQLQQLKHSAIFVDFDQHALDEIEQRLHMYHQLARKHNCKAHQLHIFHAKCQKQVDALRLQITSKHDVQQAVEDARTTLITLADLLSVRRQEASVHLCKRINQLLPQLAMENAHFAIDLSRVDILDNQPTAQGWEQPEFLLKTNVGGKLAPLRAIASGGELSRCSLAIYLACTHNADPMTMVFDEVDVGLSGKATFAIGSILKQLSQRHQVLCITHQAQICAFADAHFLVSKQHDTQATHVQVAHLCEQDSLREIARMLSGNTNATTTTMSRKLAEQMRNLALQESIQ